MSCSIWRRRGELQPTRGARTASATACWPTSARDRSSPTLPNSGSILRNLDSVNPDMRLFPDFDDNLRQAMRQETELFFESIVHEDRSVLDLHQGRLHVSQ